MARVLLVPMYLKEPVLAGGLEGDPNATTGLNYIPGSLLRGALVRRYSGNRQANDPDFRRLFLDGNTRFLNAYPALDNDRRMLPCPFSMMRCKGATDDILHDFAASEPNDSEKIWQPIASVHPFAAVLSDNDAREIATGTPSRIVQVHTQRNRNKGRAMGQDEGGVFRYDALAPNQRFLANVICEEQDVTQIRELLGHDLCMGGSRTAGYGAVQVGEVTASPLDEWSETPQEVSDFKTCTSQTVSGEFVFTLLSDLLLRDPILGQPTAAPEIAVNTLKNLLSFSDLNLEECRIFSRSTIVGGFNRKWGLPLPQTITVAKGSVFVLTGNDIALADLRSLLDRGLGERIAEGFGRVAVGWHGCRAQYKHRPMVNQHSLLPEPEGAASLQQIATRVRSMRLNRKLARDVQNVQCRVRADATSRIQRLRLAIKDDLAQGNSWNNSKIRSLLDHLDARAKRRSKYAPIRIDGQSILKWLSEYLDPTPDNRVKVTVPDFWTQAPKEVALSADECAHYQLRFAEAVLARAIKLNKREKGGEAK